MPTLAAITDVVILGLIIFGVLNVLLITASALVYAERRVAAFMQERTGPDRVGPKGLLQPFADVGKLILKEDIVPAQANRFLHGLAPTLMVVVAMSTAAVIPWARGLVIADVGVGILVVLALTSLSVYGVTLAGWASNSKYALLGGLRSSAQMISYELSMGAAVISVVLMAGTLSMTGIVEDQAGGFGLGWNFWRNPVAFVIFTVCAFAETNRAPFDLPEAEQELVGGYHTEYTGMKFGMFFLAEYVAMFVASLVIVTLFLGGYLLPLEPLFAGWFVENGLNWLLIILQLIGFVLKVGAVCFLFIWVRWTLPRFKYNQLMTLGWKILLPISIANILVIAVGVILYRSLIG
ncbi:NADH-quinone oxidoreductase subunit NuoH [soil metagenome]